METTHIHTHRFQTDNLNITYCWYKWLFFGRFCSLSWNEGTHTEWKKEAATGIKRDIQFNVLLIIFGTKAATFVCKHTQTVSEEVKNDIVLVDNHQLIWSWILLNSCQNTNMTIFNFLDDPKFRFVFSMVFSVR